VTLSLAGLAYIISIPFAARSFQRLQAATASAEGLAEPTVASENDDAM
jgi:hypothetical protein